MLQPKPKLQPKYDAAKRKEFELFFKYLDGTRPMEQAAKKASEESGLGKLDEKRREEIKRLFEESSYTFKNAPPRTLKRAPLDLWELAFKATDYTFKKGWKLRGELEKELDSMKLAIQLMREVEKINGYIEWEARKTKLPWKK